MGLNHEPPKDLVINQSFLEDDEDLDTFLRRAVCSHGKSLLEECHECTTEMEKLKGEI